MKKTTTAIILLLSLSLYSQAPKKATTATVKTELSQNESFLSIGKTLLQNGYEIEYTQKDFGYVKTAVKKKGFFPVEYYYELTASEGEIVITGKFRNIDTSKEKQSDFWEIENRGMKSSPMKKAWIRLEELAALFGKVTYE